MEKSPHYKPQVPYTKPTVPKTAVPKSHAPLYESEESKSDVYVSVQFSKETVKQYVGTWVRCHSIYGVHEGLVHRALRDGFIMVNHTALMKGTRQTARDFDLGIMQSDSSPDFEPVQFIPPFPGMFIPYGGLYGLYPRPFIW